MTLPPEDLSPRKLIGRFTALREAAIDTSSLIYMLKAGFLGLLAGVVTLRTVEEVVQESGWPSLPVVVDHPGARREEEVDTDALLLNFAVNRRLPLISEDRALLLKAGEAGLEYYNSLMMLALLRYRGRIDTAWYTEAKSHLLEVARYGDEILRRYAGICELLGFEG
ncbi:MAG: hypothetical protein ACLFP6_06245 [Spirochaetaceae bacterium]